MKLRTFVVTAIMILSITLTAFATSPKQSATIDWSKAEKNYIVAVHSENTGLRKSAVGYVGEYRLKGAVQDLIRILQEDKNESTRMTAALALVQIGEKDGLNAVEDAVLFDGSEKVSRFCDELLKAGSNSKDISLKN